MCRDLDWERIRAEYETGSTQSELSRRHGVSRTAIQKRIAKEGWLQGDVSETVARMAEARVAGVVAGCNREKMAEVLNDRADQVAAIVREQQSDFDGPSKILREAIEERNFDKAKLAKICFEAVAIKHNAQRKAWGIEKNTQEKQDSTIVVKLASEATEF